MSMPKGRNGNLVKRDKLTEITSIRMLIGEVVGAETPWFLIEDRLRTMPLEILIALHYRIARSVSAAYDDGHARGKAEK